MLDCWIDLVYLLRLETSLAVPCAVIVNVLIVLLFFSFFSLQNVLKADDKYIETKKAILKKREEDIAKEVKAAAEKKVRTLIQYLFLIL